MLQVEAGNLTPVTALVQNLLMSALFEPFEALCSAANAEMTEVWNLIDPLASLLRCDIPRHEGDHLSRDATYLGMIPSLPLAIGPVTETACQACPQNSQCASWPCFGRDEAPAEVCRCPKCAACLTLPLYLESSMPDLLLQVVEESDSSAIFRIGMVVVYGECIISEVSLSAMCCVPLALQAPSRFLNAPVCL